MSSFELALPILLRHEGGYVDDPTDPGGATSSGISLRFLKNQNLINADFDGDQAITGHDLKVMTSEQTQTLYKTCFWDALGLEKLNNQRLATAMLNICVNMGAPTGIKLLQTAVNQMLPALKLTIDGKLGPLTLKSVNLRRPSLLMATLKDLCSQYYMGIVRRHPEMSKYLRGWLARNSSY